ncbi:MAG: hypothetical protein NTV31_06300 [Bacteroidia bacterium]|nr:hypothetical protein [Bacteroidia bacterium]
MPKSNYPLDWKMDPSGHKFSILSGTNSKIVQILSFLTEYDETCLEAKAQMIKKINELLDEKQSEI